MEEAVFVNRVRFVGVWVKQVRVKAKSDRSCDGEGAGTLR